VIVFHLSWVTFLFIILLLLFLLVQNKQSPEPTTHHHQIDQNPTTTTATTSNHPTNQSKPPRHPNKNPARNPRTKTSKLTTHHRQRQAHLPIIGKTHHKINKSPTTSHHKPTKPHQKFNKTPPLATINQQNSTARERERERERERDRSFREPRRGRDRLQIGEAQSSVAKQKIL
jgi:hypothetical protein